MRINVGKNFRSLGRNNRLIFEHNRLKPKLDDYMDQRDMMMIDVTIATGMQV